MKYNELINIMKKNGWYLSKYGARHDVYRHNESKETIIIGRHGKEEVAKGLFHSIKKIVGF